MLTAAAKRAAIADRGRKAADNTKPRKRRQQLKPELDDTASDDLPPSDLLASLVNHVHGYSEIKASGRSKFKSVIVEQFGDVYRVKKTTYTYRYSLNDALELAQKENLRLQFF